MGAQRGEGGQSNGWTLRQPSTTPTPTPSAGPSPSAPPTAHPSTAPAPTPNPTPQPAPHAPPSTPADPRDTSDWHFGGATPGALGSHDTVTHNGSQTTYEHDEYSLIPGFNYSGYRLTVDHKAPTNAAKDFGGAEDATRWDLHSLDETITWLNDMHTYMNNLYNKMPDLVDLTGRTGQNSHFGTFPSASELWRKHSRCMTVSSKCSSKSCPSRRTPQ